MDGVLRVTTTSTPSIVAFEIISYDVEIAGLIDIDFEVLGVTTTAECLDKLLDSIADTYLHSLMQDRIQDKETLQ